MTLPFTLASGFPKRWTLRSLYIMLLTAAKFAFELRTTIDARFRLFIFRFRLFLRSFLGVMLSCSFLFVTKLLNFLGFVPWAFHASSFGTMILIPKTCSSSLPNWFLTLFWYLVYPTGLSLRAITHSICYGWVDLLGPWCYGWPCLLLACYGC